MWNHKIRNWLYPAIVILAVACVAWSLFHYKTNAHSYEECTRAAEIAALNDFEFNSTIDPEYKPKKSEQNQQNISNEISCSDLSAQWAMSDIAMMGYIAGLAGLFFLIITIFETKSAADLTRQALAETKTNSRKELRAYISCATKFKNCNGVSTAVIITRVKNYGQTPAINFSSRAAIKVDGQPIDFELPELDGISVQPSGEVTYDFTIDKSEFRGKKTLTIEFDIKFADIFGSDRFIRETKCIEVDYIPDEPIEIYDAHHPTKGPIGKAKSNPLYVAEIAMFTISFEDDLSQEAKEYAEANKPA